MEFPDNKFKVKKDRYQKVRGGTSKFLYITCAECDEPAMIYQKDGAGQLLRCYTDRIVWPEDLVEKLNNVTPETIRKIGAISCQSCGEFLAMPMVYKQEKRPAFRVIPNSVKLHTKP